MFGDIRKKSHFSYNTNTRIQVINISNKYPYYEYRRSIKETLLMKINESIFY